MINEYIKMIIKKEKGFTIIELLVVVAIIAVLAAIVLVNVTQYINKGKDAAIKGNMATILTNMAVWYDGNGKYNGFTGDNVYSIPAAAINNAKTQTVTTGTRTEGTDITQFCACAELYDAAASTFCIDDTGYKNQTDTACGTRCTIGITATNGRCIN